MERSVLHIPNPNIEGATLCGEFDLRGESKRIAVVCHGLLDTRGAGLVKFLAENLSCSCFRCADACFGALNMSAM